MRRSKHAGSTAPRLGLDPWHRFALALLLALVAFFASYQLLLATRLLLGWDVFAFTVVTLSTLILFTHDPYEVRRTARIQDASATLLFAIVVTAALVSLLTVGLLLHSAKSLSAEKLAGHVGVSIAAVVFSWLLVHVLFALRYAHLFYFNAREKERHNASGGLAFPGGESPNYLDFAYFSFVIGMTCQVSDVQITSGRMRRVATVHGLISFCFNTAILAMIVNIVASLL